MDIVVVGLGALVFLLGLFAVAVPVSRWLKLPFPVTLAAAALLYGSVMALLGLDVTGGALDSYDLWFLENLALEAQTALYLFLPPLLFEMALAVNVRRLTDDLVFVLIMAVVAVVTATLAVGVSVAAISGLSLGAGLLLGAAVATTDPGAVITTFRELGAPRRLMVILEGESLLNDAAAIAIFAVVLALIQNKAEPTAGGIAAGFLYAFGAGGALGLALSWAAGRLYPLLGQSPMAETSLTLALAYAAFLAGEKLIGASGVVAVVIAGLATGHVGFVRMGPGNWATVTAVWAQIGFWANALIIFIVASATPGLLMQLSPVQLVLVFVVYVAAFLARLLTLVGGMKALQVLGLAEPMSRPQIFLAWWGGVRGAVTLVLALSLTDVSALGEAGPVLGAIAAAFALTTLVLNASTLALAVRVLGLDRLSPGDLALRERIVGGALERVRTVIADLAEDRPIHKEALAEVEAALARQRAEAQAHAELERIPYGERLRLGLTILAGQEARLVRRAFDAGAIGPREHNLLRTVTERIADGARANGRAGYEAAMQAALRAGWPLRLAVLLHNRLRIDAPLRREIELRLASFFERSRMLRELDQFAADTVAPMIGEDATANLRELLAKRREGVDEQIEAIGLQYPAYAAALERVLVTRTALRRERQQYHRLFNDGVIGPELRDDLLRSVDRRERAASRPPTLDLSVGADALIDNVPLFAALDRLQRERIARRLRSVFVAPGEIVLAEGERRTPMYFIASGVLEVTDGSESITLANGDFFGELGLVAPHRRRRTSIVSLGFGRLLMLTQRDFERLTATDPRIGTAILKAAERQLLEGFRPRAATGSAAAAVSALRAGTARR